MKERIIKKNPNVDDFNKISKAIIDNDGYCCCAIERDEDTKCPCYVFRYKDDTCSCECGRFYKIIKRDIVTLCGSARFKKEILERAKELTLQGYLVFSPFFFAKTADEESQRIDLELRELSKSRIERADLIYVVNPHGYIGKNTQEEIEWARYLHKTIISDEPLEEY